QPRTGAERCTDDRQCSKQDIEMTTCQCERDGHRQSNRADKEQPCELPAPDVMHFVDRRYEQQPEAAAVVAMDVRRGANRREYEERSSPGESLGDTRCEWEQADRDRVEEREVEVAGACVVAEPGQELFADDGSGGG